MFPFLVEALRGVKGYYGAYSRAAVFYSNGRKTQFNSSLIESCEVQGHHNRFQSTSGSIQNMPFWGPPFTVLKTLIYYRILLMRRLIASWDEIAPP